jgi:hypothetical protein
VDSPEFADALAAKGYSSLVIQKGAGQYAPTRLVPPGQASEQLPSGLTVK